MSQLSRNTVLAATTLTLMLATASDSWGQFSGNRLGIRLPSVNVRGVAQQFLTGRDNLEQNYRQPSYTQPSCNQHIHPQPVYSQPVYTQPIYSQPVYSQPNVYAPPAAVQPQPVRKPTPIEVARQYTADAKVLFRRAQYTEAAKRLDEVVKRAPKDSNAYQFRALAHFANRDFENAAADAYDAMSLGNSWTQDVVKSIYGENRMGTYNNQLNKLQQVVNKTPTMQSHFLLAYYHLVNSNWSGAQMELQKVLELQPEEQLSKKLLAAVNTKLASDEKAIAMGTK